MTHIKCKSFYGFDPHSVPSPCYVVDEIAIENNLKILNDIQQKTGAKILLALKAFSMFSLGPLVSKYLSGVCASGIHEAKLGAEFFDGEIHTYSAAFSASQLSQVLDISNHVVFNSFSQWHQFQTLLKNSKKVKPHQSFGLRVNPQHSEGSNPIYDPCAPKSRLGIPKKNFEGKSLEGISGLHFHTLCEQGFDPLDRTLAAFEEQFSQLLPQLNWVNFGGGHHITHPDYDRAALIDRIKKFQNKHQLQVYLEPGEAIAIRSGVLVSEVLDLPETDCPIAILDSSATCHMPDTLEMPYQADIFGAEAQIQNQHNYRIGGQSCLAGDIMGDYSFASPLRIGQRLMFDDMAHYTMVKTTTFNGIALPSIAIWNSQTNKIKIIKNFDYNDFKQRLS